MIRSRLRKGEKKKIESSDEDSRWRFFSLVVIVYSKIRQPYSLFVFHARVTPCRHTHMHHTQATVQLIDITIKLYQLFQYLTMMNDDQINILISGQVFISLAKIPTKKNNR
jgi:hypothetical protein